MKSKSLLLLLLLALIAPWAANAQQALPYSYGFEDNDLSVDGWTTSEISTNSGINSVAANSGSYSFRFSYGDEDAYLVSPVLTGGTNGVDLSFYYKAHNASYPDHFRVGYTTDASVTDPSGFTYGEQITSSTSWQEYTAPLPAGTVRVAVWYDEGNYDDGWYLYLDDFSFTAASPYPKPTGLTVDAVTNTTATLSWTENGTATQWQICLNDDETNPIMATTNPFTLTGLTAGTAYTAKVRAYISASAQSNWSGSQPFRTNFCADDEMCAISYELTDSYGDGWNGNAIQVVDKATSVVIATLTVPSGEETATGTLPVCNGRDIDFVWVKGSYPDECSWVIYAADGTVISNEDDGSTFSNGDLIATYTVNCPSCPPPAGVTVSNITHYTADVAWTGYSDTYTVEYRTAEQNNYSFFEDFENDFDTQGWTIYTEGESISGYEGWVLYSGESHTGDQCAAAFSYYYSSLDADNWLVTPQLDLQGTLTFWNKVYSSYPDEFAVLLSTSGNAIADFTYTLRPMAAGDGTWTQISIDLSAYTGQQGYIAIHHVSEDMNYLLIDDFGICTGTTPAGAWTVATNTEASESFTLTGLTPDTDYEVRVKGKCGSEYSDLSAVKPFTTLDPDTKFFTTAGNWNVAANWEPTGTPTLTQKAIIKADATIPNGCVATADKVTLEGTSTLTIEEGGQLMHSNYGLQVTMKKHINGYSDTRDEYYLLGLPTYYSINPTSVTGMLSPEYDLYWFDGNSAGEEWQNYKASSFYLYDGEGYLYANSIDRDLEFDMTVYPSSDNNYYMTLSYDDESTAPFNGWNLLGNLFTCKAYMTKENSTDDINFYKINGTELQASNGAIDPLEAVFVKASAENQKIYWNRTAPASVSGGILNISLTQGTRGSLDLARVRFGQGEGLEKMMLNPNHSKVYVPQDGKNYAVVYSEAQGEVPLCFKAEANGSYTLSFNNENVEFGSLRLIDNLTGADVNLLATPSYSFEARTTDAANRFKLVFAATGIADNGEGSFAYLNNGNIVVVNAEAGTTLEVVDMMGRVVVIGDATRHVSTANIPAGVYVLRLNDGNSVKTQKIVIR